MSWRSFFAVVLVLLLVLLIGATQLAAQTTTTGDISGVVTDPSNAVVPDAKVSIKDNSKGNSQEAKTNKDGAYHFYLLTPGQYTLVVNAPGFEMSTRQVAVIVGQIQTADLRLTLGASTQTVTVTEAAPLIQTENGDTATAMSQQQVANVPNPGNDLSAIAQLAPGVVVNSQGGFGNVEAFGLPATSNLFTLNGMDDNDPYLNLNNSGASNLLLGSNEIQEADVVTNGYSSSYGTFAGINVNYITKSGGNDYHGNAVYFWNGRALNANDWQAKANGLSRPFDNANQWAASFGGPIKKDKLFFFLNTEGLRVLIPVPATIAVPTSQFEAATIQNLTSLGLQNSIPFYCQNLANICPGVGGVPGSGQGMFNFYNAVKNLGNATNTLNNQGCDNVVLAGFGGPVGTGTPCALQVREIPINFAPEKQVAGRADWNYGPNDRAYLRVQYDQGIQPTATDPVNPIFNTQSNQPEYQGQLSETHVFGPTMSNQFLVAATWYSAIFKPANIPATLAAFPTTVAFGDGALSGIGGADFAFPQGRNVAQFQLGDDVSKALGSHTLRFGVKYHKDYVSDHGNGVFTSGLEVPITLADFFNGGGSGTTVFWKQAFPASQNNPVRLYEVAGYIQDEWRVKSNLTITPALRLEHASNPTCVTLCFGQLSEPLSAIAANQNQPYNQILQINRRQALLGYQNLQWEPRISFAWQPFGGARGWTKSDLVVRGGIGIFYDIFPGLIAGTMTQNPPLDNFFTATSPGFGAGSNCSPGFLAPTQAGSLLACDVAAQGALLNAFNTGASALPAGLPVPGVTFTQPRTQAPQFQKWSLEIQKGFGPNDSIDIGYFGNHGVHLPILDNGLNAFGFGSLPAAPVTNQLGVLQEAISEGVSNYNGVVASYKHRFSGWAGSGVFQLNYTYSHAFDEISNGGFLPFAAALGGVFPVDSANPQNPFNIRQNYGPADYDVRHGLNANYVWEIPVRKALRGHGWAPLVDGWQVSGALFFRTGLPFSVSDGAESSNLIGGNNYGSTDFILPDILNASVNHRCNSEKFAGPNYVPCFGGTPATAGGFFGNGGGGAGSETNFGVQGLRNAFRGPSYFDTDFSFVKRTKIPSWERGELSVGLQFFNLLNHPNFTFPINDISSGSFGQIQQMVNPPTSILGSFLGGDASPRLIQVKAQLSF
jgi:hypothetical protein